MVPRILVVLGLPSNHTDWLTVTQEELILRRCAYWANLAGPPETQNRESVTIRVQDKNRFDVDASLNESSQNGQCCSMKAQILDAEALRSISPVAPITDTADAPFALRPRFRNGSNTSGRAASRGLDEDRALGDPAPNQSTGP